MQYLIGNSKLALAKDFNNLIRIDLMTGLERISVDFAAHVPPRKSVYIELYLNQLVKNHPVCERPL